MENNSGEFGREFQTFRYEGGSFGPVQEHEQFQLELKHDAKRFDFRVFCGTRDWQDLINDVNVKLLEDDMQDRLLLPDNVRTVDDLFKWLFVVTHHCHFSAIRRWCAAKRDRMRSFRPLEDYDFPVWTIEAEKDELLALFLNFLAKYPQEYQLAVELWANNESTRDISDFLRTIGVKVSHVTVGKWIRSVFEDFRKSIETTVPKDPPPVPGGGRNERNFRLDRDGGRWIVR